MAFKVCPVDPHHDHVRNCAVTTHAFTISDYSARTTVRSSQRANAKQHDLQEEWGMSQHTADLLLRR